MSAVSTKDLREKALVLVNTGEGKGKTTAACGVALRAWAHGLDVGVYQFIKSGKWHVGEEKALRALGEINGKVTWEHMGTGWTWNRNNLNNSQPQDAAVEGWRYVKSMLCQQRHDFYLLDEFTYVMARGWVDVQEVVQVLQNRPGKQHIFITGRNCPEAIISVADLVTEMRKIKHPFDSGQRGQVGIEW